MKEQYLILLLQIIKNNGKIDSLIKAGFEYSQVANFINSVKNDGFVEDKNGLLIVSPIGLKKLDELNKKFRRKNADGWISPQEEYRSIKLSKNEIYVPSKKKIKQ